MGVSALLLFGFLIWVWLAHPLADEKSNTPVADVMGFTSQSGEDWIQEGVSVDSVVVLDGFCRVRFSLTGFDDGECSVTVGLIGDDGYAVSMENGRKLASVHLWDVLVKGGVASVQADLPCDDTALERGRIIEVLVTQSKETVRQRQSLDEFGL